MEDSKIWRNSYRILRACYISALKSVDGSITPLISGLFLILLALSAGLVNIADSSMAKRELIQIVEPEIQKALQSIDLYRYYNGNTFISLLNQFHDSQARVPIDCSSAVNQLKRNISQTYLRGKPIYIDEIVCTQEELVIAVNSQIHAIIDFPIFTTALKSKNSVRGEIAINAKIGATSIFK